MRGALYWYAQHAAFRHLRCHASRLLHMLASAARATFMRAVCCGDITAPPRCGQCAPARYVARDTFLRTGRGARIMIGTRKQPLPVDLVNISK